MARRCAKVQAKSDEAHKKAEEERDSIRRDLDNVRDDLARITYVVVFLLLTFAIDLYLVNYLARRQAL